MKDKLGRQQAEKLLGIRKIARIGCYLRHICLTVCLSVRVEQLCSHWTEFHGI
jgi:hypothetical protein